MIVVVVTKVHTLIKVHLKWVHFNEHTWFPDLDLYCLCPPKGRGLLKEMVASGAGAGLHKMSLEHFVVPENSEVTMIIITKRQAYHKEIITNSKGFPLAKSGKMWV